MEDFEADYHLEEDAPDLLFLHEFLVFLELCDFCLDIAVVGIFHYDAEALGGLFEESFLEADYVGVSGRGL